MSDASTATSVSLPGTALDYSAARRALRGFETGFGVFLAGGAIALATSAWVAWEYWRLPNVVAAYGWGGVPPEEVSAFAFFERWGVALDLVTVVIYWGGFFAAMLFARRLGVAVGVVDYRYSAAWTPITMLIPLVCLWRPWLGLAEIRRSMKLSVVTGAPTSQGATNGFTGLLAATFFLGYGAMRGLVNAMDRATTPVDMASFEVWLSRITPLITGVIVAQIAILGVMFIYLVTLRPWARTLAQNPPLARVFD